MTSTVIPRRPYLLRAMHQWMTDNGLTPQVMVDASATGADVPKAHVRDGRIVLNVSYSATRHLDLGNDWISFEARFGGIARQLRFPVLAVQSIYARETGDLASPILARRRYELACRAGDAAACERAAPPQGRAP